MVIYSLCRRLDVYRPRLLLVSFRHPEMASLKIRRDQYGHLLPLSKTRCLLIETTFSLPSSSRDGKSDDRDQYGHLLPLSKTRCLSTETTFSLPSSCRDGKSDDTKRPIWSSFPFVEDSMSIGRDYFQSPFVIQRQSSSMTRSDHHGRLHPLSKT